MQSGNNGRKFLFMLRVHMNVEMGPSRDPDILGEFAVEVSLDATLRPCRWKMKQYVAQL